jgi:hypothetical protein
MVIWPPFAVSYRALLTPVTLAAGCTVDDVDCTALGHRPCRGQWPEQCACLTRVRTSHEVEEKRVTRFGKGSGFPPFFFIFCPSLKPGVLVYLFFAVLKLPLALYA